MNIYFKNRNANIFNRTSDVYTKLRLNDFFNQMFFHKITTVEKSKS